MPKYLVGYADLLTFALENNNEIVYVTISVANINKKCRICKQKE